MPTSSPPELLIVAGEASADAHAAEVLHDVQRLRPEVHAFGMGGALLRGAGLEALVHAEDMGVAGLTEVITALPRIIRFFKRIEREAAKRRPRAALLVDMPDFNLRLAKRLKALGIRVVYYISPQVWAWRPGRVESIRKRVDDMLVVLPFEEAFYRARGVPARFVGHPSVGQVFAGQPVLSPQQARERLHISPGAPVVALLPGSRRQELNRHLPAMLETLSELNRRGHPVRGVIPIAHSLPRAEVEGLVAQTRQRLLDPIELRLVDGRAHEVLAAADVAIVCSGTATLEAGLIGRPMIVVYRVSALTFWLLRRLVRVSHVALVNLIAKKDIVPELLQNAMHPLQLASATLTLLQNEPQRARQQRDLFAIRQQLSEKPAALEVARTLLGHVDAATVKPRTRDMA